MLSKSRPPPCSVLGLELWQPLSLSLHPHHNQGPQHWQLCVNLHGTISILPSHQHPYYGSWNLFLWGYSQFCLQGHQHWCLMLFQVGSCGENPAPLLGTDSGKFQIQDRPWQSLLWSILPPLVVRSMVGSLRLSTKYIIMVALAVAQSVYFLALEGGVWPVQQMGKNGKGNLVDGRNNILAGYVVHRQMFWEWWSDQDREGLRFLSWSLQVISLWMGTSSFLPSANSPPWHRDAHVASTLHKPITDIDHFHVCWTTNRMICVDWSHTKKT